MKKNLARLLPHSEDLAIIQIHNRQVLFPQLALAA
jgi:hypothetical protein